MHRGITRWTLAIALAGWLVPHVSAAGEESAADSKLFREIYQELIEINTTDSVGDTTVAARAMAQRLKAGGFTDTELRIIVPPEAPRKGNLVARFGGSGLKRPLLLLAHLDVVEAKREDWPRDPFKLVEEDGQFFARGAIDDKAMAAAFVSDMIRLRREGFRSDRDIIVALTADEEIIPSRFNGVQFLLAHHRDLIDAELALNEGGYGVIGKNGQYLYHGIQAGEKVFQTFRLEVTNPGGHSARPSRDNAIYHLADGLSRLGKFDFPFKLNEVTRAYFERLARIESGQLASDMQAILRVQPDQGALERIGNVPAYNSLIRTTCVATMVDAGHATNALPQRARAVVNCRVLPGDSVDDVRETLVRVMNDDKIAITADGQPVASPAPPLSPAIMEPIERISAEMWPGIPVVPTMLAAATDGRFLNNVGIWTYGVSGIFRDLDGNGVHGVNEHVRVKALDDSQEFLYRLIKSLANS